MGKGTYKVKRYTIRGPGFDKRNWETVDSSTNKAKAERLFIGWISKLPGGDFRLESPGGRVVKKRYAGVFRLKSEQEGFRKHKRRK